MVPLIRLIVALEILALPAWVGAACVRPPEGIRPRLARTPAMVVLAAIVLLVLAVIEGGGSVAGVLRSQAVAVGFTVFLAGLAAALQRAAGPRAAQMLTALLGWALVGSILLAGPVVEMIQGPAKAMIVRLVVLADPLVAAEREVGLPWLHQSLTYRLTPLGESYNYLLEDLTWWKTLVAHVFIGSGLLVFGVARRGGPKA